ncbi:MAG: metal ABC transporter permease, partial [Candidatus Binatia bacterium]
MSFLIPFEYEFFRNGFFAAVSVGALCGFIGVYVVLRRMSYIGHGLSHALFGGAVLSYVMNVNFFIGAGVWALLASFLIHLISHRRWVGADAAIGVVTTSSFALGVAIISTHR